MTCPVSRAHRQKDGERTVQSSGVTSESPRSRLGCRSTIFNLYPDSITYRTIAGALNKLAAETPPAAPSSQTPQPPAPCWLEVRPCRLFATVTLDCSVAYFLCDADGSHCLVLRIF